MSAPGKPQTPVVFTEMEKIEINKMIQGISQAFLLQHIEITSPAGSDLADMIRKEKQMYANLGVQFAVNSMFAQKKRDES